MKQQQREREKFMVEGAKLTTEGERSSATELLLFVDKFLGFVLDF
jgi:hypothetical protein